MSWWRRLVGWGTGTPQATTAPTRRATSTNPVWEGAGGGRRWRGFTAWGHGPNAALAAGVETLRTRTRQMVRNNGWAGRALETFVANIVGTGIVPRSRSNSPAFRKAFRELWADWTDQADATGTTDAYGLQALAVRAMGESGECFLRVRYRRPDDVDPEGVPLAVPMQLEVLEADFVPFGETRRLEGGGQIVDGIEYDAIGRRVAYWMWPSHPGEVLQSQRDAGQLRRIPAENVLHVFRPLRPGAQRGEPRLASALLALYDLESGDDAELLRRKLAAMIAGVITSPTGEGPQLGETEAGPTAEGLTEVSAEAGSFPLLQPGQEIKQFDAPDPGPSLDTFLQHHLRRVAAASGVTYEALTGDLGNVNFSSARVALLEMRRQYEALIWHTVIFQLCRRVAIRFVRTAVASGALRVVDFTTPRGQLDAFRVQWNPRGWEYLNPQQEAQADVLRLTAGLTSRQRIAAKAGDDIEEIDRENADDAARATALGLAYSALAPKSAAPAPDMTPADDEPQPQRGRRAA